MLSGTNRYPSITHHVALFLVDSAAPLFAGSVKHCPTTGHCELIAVLLISNALNKNQGVQNMLPIVPVFICLLDFSVVDVILLGGSGPFPKFVKHHFSHPLVCLSAIKGRKHLTLGVRCLCLSVNPIFYQIFKFADLIFYGPSHLSGLCQQPISRSQFL